MQQSREADGLAASLALVPFTGTCRRVAGGVVIDLDAVAVAAAELRASGRYTLVRHMRSLRFVYLVVGIFLVCAAGFAAFASSRALIEARASTAWPSAPGSVTSTRTVLIPGRHGSSGPDIRYTYAVGGRRFNGSRLEVVTYSANTSYASDAVAEFREGAEVPVYYDPAHLESSVLRRGANWVAYAVPMLSLIMIVFGVALVRLSIRLGRTPRTT